MNDTRRAHSAPARSSPENVSDTTLTGNRHRDDEPETHHGHSHDTEGYGFIKFCLVFCALFMLAELITGYYFGSIALVADAMHMLSDLVGGLISIYGNQLSAKSKETHRFTYGLGRAQFLANLLNATILLALCLTLTLESLQRYYVPEVIEAPPVPIILGGIGAIFKFLVHKKLEAAQEAVDSAPSQASHSLARTFRSSRLQVIPACYRYGQFLSARHTATGDGSWIAHSGPHGPHSHEHSHEPLFQAKAEEDPDYAHNFVPQQHHADHQGMDVHMLMDLLGNIAITLDGVLYLLLGPVQHMFGRQVGGLLATWSGIVVIDPTASMIVVALTIHHAYPLVAATSFALLQGIEPERVDSLATDLHTHVPYLTGRGVLELRCWSSVKDVRIGSAKLETSATNLHEVATVQHHAKQMFRIHGFRLENV